MLNPGNISAGDMLGCKEMTRVDGFKKFMLS